MSIRFSIIIATCGRPEPLAAALESVCAAVKESGADHRIIVVDNGPGWPAEGVARDLARKTGVRILHLKSELRNKAKALNLGIRTADTDWLAFTDDDTRPDAQWLKMGAEFAAHSGYRIFGGRLIPGPVEQPLPRWLRPGLSGRIPNIGVFAWYLPAQASGRLPDHAPVPFGANVFIHKRIFEQYGGYDESLWALCGRRALGVEDTEFGVRVKEGGEPIGYCREALVVHPIRYDRARLSVHFRLAYWYGWREPIIFYFPHRPLLERYRLRIVISRIVRAVADFARGDWAGGTDHLVEMIRCGAGIPGRLSAAYRRRAAWLRTAASLNPEP